MGVGYDGVDVAAAKARGVLVTHTPDVLNDDVADLAIALVLNIARRIPQADRHVRAGQVAEGPDAAGDQDVAARAWASSAWAASARPSRTRARAFGMPVAYTARSAKPELPYTFHDQVTRAGGAERLPGRHHAGRRRRRAS